MAVLITRPESDASDTAEKVRQLGLNTICVPVMHITLTPPAALPLGAILIVTSKNALRSLSMSAEQTGDITVRPIVIAGASTASLATELGHTQVHLASGTAETVAKTAIETANTLGLNRAVYLHGAHITHDIASELTTQGLPCSSVEVYSASPAAPFAIQKADAASITHVLHFSPRQAALYAELAHEQIIHAGANVQHLCLSNRVRQSLLAAAALTTCPVVESDIQTANHPTQEELLAHLPGGAAQSSVK